MPYNVTIPYDLDIWNIFLDTIKTSIRSISGMGLYILAYVLVWVVLTVIINHFTSISKLKTAVKKRSFARKVFETDFNKNQEELIEDGVRHSRLRLFTNQRMRDNHLDEVMSDQVENNRVRLLAKLEFGKKHMNLEVADKVHSMEVMHAAKKEYASKHPGAFGEEKDLHKQQAADYYRNRKGGV